MFGSGNRIAAWSGHDDRSGVWRGGSHIHISHTDYRRGPRPRDWVAASSTGAVTFVWLRTTRAENSGIILMISASDRPVLTTTSKAPPEESSFTPRWETGSATRTFGTRIEPARLFTREADVKARPEKALRRAETFVNTPARTSTLQGFVR